MIPPETENKTAAASGTAEATTKTSDLSPLAEDMRRDIALIKQTISDIKAQGTVAGITNNAGNIINAAKDDYQDVNTALPAIKSGYKTTEFWLIAAFLGGNAVYVALTGHTLPMDIDALTGTVIAIYTAFRSMAKKTTTTTGTPATPPATGATPTTAA